MIFIATLRTELSSITTRRLHESTARMAQRRQWTASETPRRWAGGAGGVDGAGVEDSVGVGGGAIGVSSVVGGSAIAGRGRRLQVVGGSARPADLRGSHRPDRCR